MPTRQRPFSPGELEAVCKALADTATGLTGTEIGHALAQIRVSDPEPTGTKWRRLFNALAARQNSDRAGNKVLSFINAALEPSRYAGNQASFHTRRAAVNVPLAFYGLQYGEDGKFHSCAPASTLDEATRRADRLRTALQQRNVDAEVLTFCRAELLQENYFHAVLEATKSVASKIRVLTGLTSDGAELAQQAFGGDNPLLRINSLATDTHRGEQRGFANLMVGLFGTFRNPTAHAARSEWPLPEEDALDLFCLTSYAHRRLRRSTLRP